MDQAREESQLEATQNKPKTRSKIPPLPPWPTSKPGPTVTEPPPGQRLMPLRTDQVVEINYDQERGMPVVPVPERLVAE
jgi:hypothetical protein